MNKSLFLVAMRKNINFSIYILLISCVSLQCSKKEDKRYCAECYETTYGSWAPNFCGTSSEVNDYINLMEYNSPYPQYWVCSKYDE